MFRGRKSRKAEAEPPVSGDLAPRALRIVSAGQSRALVFERASGRARFLPIPAAQVLSRLEGLRSASEHAGAFGQAAPLALAAIEELARGGLLIGRERLAEALSAPAGEEAQPRIASVACSTARQLESFAADAARHGREPGWLVFDEGGGEREALASARVRALYCGPQEREAMAQRLAAEAGVPAELARSALSGRNAVLLSTAGSVVFCPEAGALCELCGPPQAQAGLAFSSESDESEVFQFEEGEELPLVEDDLLARQEALLARSAAECASTVAPEEVDLRSASGELLDLLLSGTARVLVTSVGSFGEAGESDRDDLLWAGVPLPEGFASVSAHILRCTPKQCVTDLPRVLSGSLALDNRQMLPPFLPASGDQAALFARTLRAVRPEALIGVEALAIRRQRDATLQGADAASDLLVALLRDRGSCPWDRDPSERLANLGAELARLGRLAPKDLLEVATTAVLEQRGLRIASGEELLRRYRGEPEDWARELERALEEMERETADSAAISAEAAARLGRVLSLCGELLRAWPALWRAAAGLAAAGLAAVGPWGLVPLP